MRVIAGKAKGLRLKSIPGQTTRPTSDKVKEAVFSMIGPSFFEGGAVLDLFAGTGGLGIEALSRGMDQAVFIDVDRKSVAIIHENLAFTQFISQAEVYKQEAARGLKLLANRAKKFKLVLLDPPYHLTNLEQWIELLQMHTLLEEGARIMLEHDRTVTVADRIGSCSVWKRAQFGTTAVTLYEYVSL